MTIKVEQTEKGLYVGETKPDSEALAVVVGKTSATENEIECAQLPDIQIKIKDSKP